MPTLTEYQNDLLSNLTKEFDRLNPKQDTNAVKRFSAKTITECLNEEAKFKDTIVKYNTAMGLMLKKDFEKQIKAVTAEYKSVFNISSNGVDKYGDKNYGTYAKVFESSKQLEPLDSTEALIHFVSKTKPHLGETRDNIFNYKAYVTIYCSYKYERVDIVLQSGKTVMLKKIVGHLFSTHDWLGNKNSYATNCRTIDDLIQSSKDLQQKLVKLY